MRILLIDDHTLFAEAIRPVLEAEGMAVLDLETSGAAGLAAANRESPDMILVDLGLPDMPGLMVGRQILELLPDSKVVAVTGLDAEISEREVMRAGFHGFITKDSPLPRFIDSLRAVIEGEAIRLAERGPARPRQNRQVVDREAALLAGQLTPRELEVLEILVSGGSNSEVAQRLSLSPNTVRTHVQSILTKLQVRSRLEAAAFAVRCGLVSAQAESQYA